MAEFAGHHKGYLLPFLSESNQLIFDKDCVTYSQHGNHDGPLGDIWNTVLAVKSNLLTVVQYPGHNQYETPHPLTIRVSTLDVHTLAAMGITCCPDAIIGLAYSDPAHLNLMEPNDDRTRAVYQDVLRAGAESFADIQQPVIQILPHPASPQSLLASAQPAISSTSDSVGTPPPARFNQVGDPPVQSSQPHLTLFCPCHCSNQHTYSTACSLSIHYLFVLTVLI
jgi:hypothetical protein